MTGIQRKAIWASVLMALILIVLLCAQSRSGSVSGIEFLPSPLDWGFGKGGQFGLTLSADRYYSATVHQVGPFVFKREHPLPKLTDNVTLDRILPDVVLYDTRSGKRIGTVLAIYEAYEFGDNNVQPGVLLLRDNGSEVWTPRTNFTSGVIIPPYFWP
jgi:hypothetical protein